MRIRKLLKKFSIAISSIGFYRKPYCTVLMYHMTSGDSPYSYDIDPGEFDMQMKFISQNHTVIKLTDILNPHIYQKRKNFLILTFDDGFSDFYTHAFPLLLKYNLPSTLFVHTGFIDGDSSPSSNPLHKTVPMTWEQLSEVSSSGLVDIGSHTISHPNLHILNSDNINFELQESKEYLESKIGYPINSFAYPRGFWNIRVENFASYYYQFICRVGCQSVNSSHINPKKITRVPIYRHDTFSDFCYRIRNFLWFEQFLVRNIKKILIGSNY